MNFLEAFRFWLRPKTPQGEAPLTTKALVGLVALLLVSIAVRLGMLEFLEGLKADQGVFQEPGEVESLSPLMFVLFGILLMPILEELLFRGALLRPWASIGAAMGVAGYFLYHLVVQPPVLEFRVMAALVAVGVFLMANRYRSGWQPRLDQWYRRGFPAWFYLSAFMFGLVHLSNFSWETDAWWWLPLFVSPHMVSGMVYGYAAVRYGVRVSIGMHMLNNAIGYGLFLVGY